MTSPDLVWGHEVIRHVLVEEGPQNLHNLAQQVGTHSRRMKILLADLVQEGRVYHARIGRGARYLWRTPEIAACECDGTCLRQLVALHEPRCEKLLGLVPREAMINTSHLVQSARRHHGWSDRTTHKWLKHLLEIELLELAEPEMGDLRTRWYKQRDPHPTVVAFLQNRQISFS